MKIVGISGSLRKASYNRMLLQACAELAPDGMTIDVHTIEGVPLFNEDDEPSGDSEAVARLKAAIARADGLLVVTPEYNGSVPGVLKNAVDWLSRSSGGTTVLKGKPAGIVGTSPGILGTVRAQAHLRAALEHNAAPVMPVPQVFVGGAREKFDAEGRLVDEKTRMFLAKYLEAFAEWVRRNGVTP